MISGTLSEKNPGLILRLLFTTVGVRLSGNQEGGIPYRGTEEAEGGSCRWIHIIMLLIFTTDQSLFLVM